MKKILAQGAEAILTLKKNIVNKDRISKGYRIKEIDEKLRKQRTKREANLLEKASKIINVPKIIRQTPFSLELEYIKGDKLSETLNSYQEKKQKEVMQLLGQEVGKLHDADIIHGDLTTSNTILVKIDKKAKAEQVLMGEESQVPNNKVEPCNTKNPQSNNKLVGGANRPLNKSEARYSAEPDVVELAKLASEKAGKVFIIDFGLGFISKRIEDKAVDLHLIKQALEAKHFQNWQFLFDNFLQGYNPKEKTQILKQLEKVEARGRYKH